MATINIRVDEKLKNDAEQVFEELGLSTTTAMTIFLKAVVRNGGIPFSLVLPNKETLKAFEEVDKISSGKINRKRYASSTELRKDLKV